MYLKHILIIAGCLLAGYLVANSAAKPEPAPEPAKAQATPVAVPVATAIQATPHSEPKLTQPQPAAKVVAENALLAEVNRVRAQQTPPLPPYLHSPALEHQATYWAGVCESRGDSWTRNHGHDGCLDRLAACGIVPKGNNGLVPEVIAWPLPNEKWAVHAWMSSTGHRAMLLGDYKYWGGARSGDYWVGLAGTPSSAATKTTPVASKAPAKPADECQCTGPGDPACTCAVCKCHQFTCWACSGSKVLYDDKTGKPEACAACKGTGKVASPSKPAGVVCEDGQCRFTEPQSDYVTFQQPYTYRSGWRGRRSSTGYRNVTMLRSDYERQYGTNAQPATQARTYYYRSGGGCRSCR